MTIANYRSQEPLYIIMIRENNPESQLKDWARSHKIQATIEGNRMKLFDHHALSIFHMNWKGDWGQVTIWDCWNKRHIYSF